MRVRSSVVRRKRSSKSGKNHNFHHWVTTSRSRPGCPTCARLHVPSDLSLAEFDYLNSDQKFFETKLPNFCTGQPRRPAVGGFKTTAAAAAAAAAWW